MQSPSPSRFDFYTLCVCGRVRVTQSVVSGDLEGKVRRCLFVHTPHIVMTKISLKNQQSLLLNMFIPCMTQDPTPLEFTLLYDVLHSVVFILSTRMDLATNSKILYWFYVWSRLALCVEIAAGLLSRGGKMESSETIYNS